MVPATRRSFLVLALAAGTPAFLGAFSAPRIASAHQFTAGALTIQHPWARATAGGAKAGALYLTVANGGAEADRLTSVTTEAAGRCELHLSEMNGDVMSMKMVDSVEVPAGGRAAFAPQGAHIMLLGLKAPLKKGTRFAATLHFEKAGDVAIEVAVQGIGDLKPQE